MSKDVKAFKKFTKLTSSISHSPFIKSKEAHDLVSSINQCWAEHYKELFSDSIDPSRNLSNYNYEFLLECRRPLFLFQNFKGYIMSMKINKNFIGLDRLFIEFYK